MPIELGWWVLPMFKTGVIFIFLLGLPALLLEDAKPDNLISTVLLWFAVSPLLVSVFFLIVWFLANVLIIIWR
jgi:hypothetical protein